ncbi:hypothetical protein I307_04250 [Cryptococcus deuterogattii 99/473]|uniref:Uncharacterized protein n=2 Tax=Cryptococcus deuterogattii TaxID=1859096 RepID=A0A0D0V9M4_9TREE|nr:hypothetical protein CNBG_1038 [Cryptococcus deuterogattii R265]KIR26499.1 hypothetical protein I309_04655 [Cryptococcus deuterogattii LA55]KIR35927.1 hypothetical protein I352_00869 [Cryptococcus deuterogattii MMRL2647]KIR43114.1 hypothetical protein I313_01323 [Cryptococcus deuterogattii Ram5]KIR75360.1 hypothetical protein I310_00051 [Cryptococcus deuterogattii CA1014]KIR95301.1 hypothetical protein I304_00050 [Cryptococcus deuterogattii CBS 10090]KIS01796.1 hypothetical protein L804_00
MSSSAHPLLPPLHANTSARFLIPSVHEDEHTFHPHSSLSLATNIAVRSAGVGLLVSATQNALDKHNHGALGIFTRTGSTITLFAAMGFSYSFVTALTANIRETDGPLNSAAGGCAAGFVAGVQHRSIPVAVGACAGMAALLGTFNAAGNNLTGVARKDIPRPEREEIRQQFFKQHKATQEE